jgi:DNA-binding response OmpR family regulator
MPVCGRRNGETRRNFQGKGMMMIEHPQLAGLRVLVLEDEMLVALLVEETLIDQHCIVIGPASTVQEALALANTEPLDAAVIDVNIGGEKAYPVAELLDVRGIPFLFVSGYGQSAVPKDRPNWRVCAKPFRGEEMVRMLTNQVMDRRRDR